MYNVKRLKYALSHFPPINLILMGLLSIAMAITVNQILDTSSSCHIFIDTGLDRIEPGGPIGAISSSPPMWPHPFFTLLTALSPAFWRQLIKGWQRYLKYLCEFRPNLMNRQEISKSVFFSSCIWTWPRFIPSICNVMGTNSALQHAIIEGATCYLLGRLSVAVAGHVNQISNEIKIWYATHDAQDHKRTPICTAIGSQEFHFGRIRSQQSFEEYEPFYWFTLPHPHGNSHHLCLGLQGSYTSWPWSV